MSEKPKERKLSAGARDSRASAETKKHQLLKASAQPLRPVVETTFYPSDFPAFLRKRMDGKTLPEVAAELEVPLKDFLRLLNGDWRPGKRVCKKLRLKVVYAIDD